MDFLSSLSAQQGRRLRALFLFVSNQEEVHNVQVFRRESTQISVFGTGHLRLPCFCVNNVRYLTHGFFAENEVWLPDNESARAIEIMQEHVTL
jgi:hypothetical protein